MTSAPPPRPVEFTRAAPLAVIALRDKENHNRITPGLRAGLLAALAEAGSDEQLRCVLLEGLPDIFCAGAGVKRMLSGPMERTAQVWDLAEALLACPVPVVAAAQGHALGGGFLLALYCDAVVLSERSRYGANFLPYGFTPTLGATHLLPDKLGPALGAEMLYTGRTAPGRELRERGAGVLVAAHEEVPGVARRLALRMARAPRDCLGRLKSQLAGEVRRQCQAAMIRETPDHEDTIATAEARRRIVTLHGETMDGLVVPG